MILDADENVIVEDVKVETKGKSVATCKLVDRISGKDSNQLWKCIDG